MTSLALTPFEQYALHLLVGLVLGLISKKRWFLLSFIVGVSKEIFDEVSYGGFDIVDLVFTVIGGLLGSLLQSSRKK